MKPLYAFVVNLVQDVSICRPIIQFARATFDCDILVLCTSAFFRSDITGVWAGETAALIADFGANLVTVENTYGALAQLQDRQGMIVAPSESELEAHEATHQLFQACPRTFLKVTLQHGLECVGFLHNRGHDRAYGERIGFAADILVGWFEAESMLSMKDYERQKLFVAGPPMMLCAPGESRAERERGRMRGLICENLHSVRLPSAGSKHSFIGSITNFAQRLAAVNGSIDLRPHPAGQFTTRTKFELPNGVVRNTAPLYRQDLSVFDFGITAPSSVLLDMILADVPVAVWQDDYDTLDIANYRGLPVVHDAGEWWDFAQQASSERDGLLRQQRAFFDDLGIPSNVQQRYRTLLSFAAVACP